MALNPNLTTLLLCPWAIDLTSLRISHRRQAQTYNSVCNPQYTPMTCSTACSDTLAPVTGSQARPPVDKTWSVHQKHASDGSNYKAICQLYGQPLRRTLEPEGEKRRKWGRITDTEARCLLGEVEAEQSSGVTRFWRSLCRASVVSPLNSPSTWTNNREKIKSKKILFVNMQYKNADF